VIQKKLPRKESTQTELYCSFQYGTHSSARKPFWLVTKLKRDKKTSCLLTSILVLQKDYRLDLVLFIFCKKKIFFLEHTLPGLEEGLHGKLVLCSGRKPRKIPTAVNVVLCLVQFQPIRAIALEIKTLTPSVPKKQEQETFLKTCTV
jgi:hypothetical protein